MLMIVVQSTQEGWRMPSSSCKSPQHPKFFVGIAIHPQLEPSSQQRPIQCASRVGLPLPISSWRCVGCWTRPGLLQWRGQVERLCLHGLLPRVHAACRTGHCWYGRSCTPSWQSCIVALWLSGHQRRARLSGCHAALCRQRRGTAGERRSRHSRYHGAYAAGGRTAEQQHR